MKANEPTVICCSAYCLVYNSIICCHPYSGADRSDHHVIIEGSSSFVESVEEIHTSK